jgi:hypothetical protein
MTEAQKVLLRQLVRGEKSNCLDNARRYELEREGLETDPTAAQKDKLWSKDKQQYWETRAKDCEAIEQDLKL